MNIIKVDIIYLYFYLMDNINTDKIININKKVINFERFIIRRTYGLYYLIWALAFSGFEIIPIIVLGFYYNKNLMELYILYFIAYFIIIIIAVKLSKNLFSKVYKTYKLKYGYIKKNSNNKKYFYVFTAMLIIVIFLYFFERQFFYYGLFVYLINISTVAMDIKIHGYLKLSFDKIPFEGYIAVYSYLLSSLLTMVFFTFSVFFFKGIVYYSFTMWFIAVIGWFFSSFYAIYHAPDEVVCDE